MVVQAWRNLLTRGRSFERVDFQLHFQRDRRFLAFTEKGRYQRHYA